MYKYLFPDMEAGILLFVEVRLDSIAAGIAVVYGIAEAYRTARNVQAGPLGRQT